MELPSQVQKILDTFEKHGFEAYAVGGCVRDFLRGVEPKDWDVATSAKPKEIQKIFPKSFYKNKFGTVTVLTGARKRSLAEIEITTYRLEAKYTDKRHPDRVQFTTDLKKDLSRRDFTINAMAFDGKEIIDLYEGQKDLKAKIIRAVGDPDERFSEDALRMLRAIRLACELGFKIEKKTLLAIQKNSGWIRAIAKERIRDEFIRIIMSDVPAKGIMLLLKAKLLRYIIPELEKGIGIDQPRHHIYTIFKHSVMTLKYAKGYNLVVRLAALLHDIAKPETKKEKEGLATFYNHDVVGAKIAIGILTRLKFPKDVISRVANLIRHHMFYYNVGEVTEAGVRRLVRRVGPENMEDLINLRIADRLGSGCPKAKPYKLRHLEYLINKVSRDPISVSMLKIDGNDVMKILNIPPGPKVGMILNALLAEVLEDPKKNTKTYLKKATVEFGKLSLDELRKKVKKVKEKKEEIEIQERMRFRV